MWAAKIKHFPHIKSSKDYLRWNIYAWFPIRSDSKLSVRMIWVDHFEELWNLHDSLRWILIVHRKQFHRFPDFSNFQTKKDGWRSFSCVTEKNSWKSGEIDSPYGQLARLGLTTGIRFWQAPFPGLLFIFIIDKYCRWYIRKESTRPHK